LAVLGATSKL